jgi:outer membrane protein
VRTDKFLSIFVVATAILCLSGPNIYAQTSISLSLDNSKTLALQNNHLLNIRKLQVKEKRYKVSEDKVKYLPAIIAGGSYQYNSNLPTLTIEQGRFGTLPLGAILIPMPAKDEVIEMGNHNNYQAGVTLYQPITQLGKINAGVNVSKTEYGIAQDEEIKAESQIMQAVEKLYFGLLVIQKQIEEADLKVTLAKMKLADVSSAISAGKTTESNGYGLSAAEADEEQNLLKLRIKYEDYAADLKQLTGLDPGSSITLEPVNAESLIEIIPAIDTALNDAIAGNSDLKIASLYKTKADNAILASKFSYLPDIGLLGGYTYQDGSAIYPKNNAFIGASLKWNIQDALSNRTVQLQRISARKQAEENLANTREQVSKDIAKTCRKLKQSEELIKVAEKVVMFRRMDLKIQADRRSSGLNLEADYLAAKAAMAKAESDYYAAQLDYRITLSELKILIGNY